MLLLLARHGNTFAAGDKIFWVGARTDLPLTEKGVEQAVALGHALRPLGNRLKRIVAGPLKRTEDHAKLAAAELGFKGDIEIDGRLREIDYGLWEGKSTEEIKSLGSEEELRAWDERGVWPSSPMWAPPEAALTKNVAQIANNFAVGLDEEDAALLVTSNGILKFFLKLVPGGFEDMAANGLLKVATGHCCALRHTASGWRVLFWNREPARIGFE